MDRGSVSPEHRRAPRNSRVTGGLPGRLIADTDQVDVSAKVVDISQNGIGLVTEVPLKPGTNIWLLVDDRALKLEVRHCTAAFEGDMPGFRCGLLATVQFQDVEEIFFRKNLIAPDPS